jgi:hypothetical protein
MSILKKKVKKEIVETPKEEIPILELDFGRADLNLLVEKLNEVIVKGNK